MANKREITYIINEQGCHICTSHKSKHCGYPQCTRSGAPSSVLRFLWITKYGPIPEGLLLCHKCDNPLCINIDHAFLGTHSDNMQDCKNKGRYVNNYAGEKNPGAKLNKEKAEIIKTSSLPNRELAIIYEVSSSCISAIKRGEYWK